MTKFKIYETKWFHFTGFFLNGWMLFHISIVLPILTLGVGPSAEEEFAQLTAIVASFPIPD